MSSLAPDIGDAVRPDGTLKDASEIVWNFDADDSIPFPSDDASGARIFSDGVQPAAVPSVSLRRTTRTIRPSRRYLEGAESDSSAPATTPIATKCKASCKSPARHVAKKVVINVDDENDEDSDASSDDRGNTTEAITEPASEPASEDYEALKAIADSNVKVHSHRLYFQIIYSFTSQAVTVISKEARTADIRLIFHLEKGYVHPITRKVLNGHWCTVCR